MRVIVLDGRARRDSEPLIAHTAAYLGKYGIRLERVRSGNEQRVAAEIELALLRQDTRKLLLLETYREERTASGSSVGESVTALEQAVSAIFERFVADIPRS